MAVFLVNIIIKNINTTIYGKIILYIYIYKHFALNFLDVLVEVGSKGQQGCVERLKFEIVFTSVVIGMCYTDVNCKTEICRLVPAVSLTFTAVSIHLDASLSPVDALVAARRIMPRWRHRNVVR